MAVKKKSFKRESHNFLKGNIQRANMCHRYVSELLYIHSKLMIVDDRRVIVSYPFQLSWLFTYGHFLDGFGQYQ